MYMYMYVYVCLYVYIYLYIYKCNNICKYNNKNNNHYFRKNQFKLLNILYYINISLQYINISLLGYFYLILNVKCK